MSGETAHKKSEIAFVERGPRHCPRLITFSLPGWTVKKAECAWRERLGGDARSPGSVPRAGGGLQIDQRVREFTDRL